MCSSCQWRGEGQDFSSPLVFYGAISTWPARKWTVQDIADILQDKLLRCKIASCDTKEYQWETECAHVKVTFHHYLAWLEDSVGSDNPLHGVDRKRFSCYIDYKYMKDVFQGHEEFLKGVDWSVFGLLGRDGADSTLWVGSGGTYTPCHQDTYGFNLVAQIQGRKRWYLFPPNQTAQLYPTRVPYEESSVYSQVNIRAPNLSHHPKFKQCTPYMIELGPGEVLYVPQHWWHFVETLEPSFSINTWVPLASDSSSHVEESVCRLLFSSLASHLLSPEQIHACLNTGESLESSKTDMQYVKMAVHNHLSESSPTRAPPDNLHMVRRHFQNHTVESLSPCGCLKVGRKRKAESNEEHEWKLLCSGSRHQKPCVDSSDSSESSISSAVDCSKTASTVDSKLRIRKKEIVQRQTNDIQKQGASKLNDDGTKETNINIVALSPMSFDKFCTFLKGTFGYNGFDNLDSAATGVPITDNTGKMVNVVTDITEGVEQEEHKHTKTWHKSTVENVESVSCETESEHESCCENKNLDDISLQEKISNVSEIDVIKAVLHPTVITQICKLLTDDVV
ncbi:HSPB1-associated protein 1-like isoform X2 [Mya arenaria]|nr:HSPB1-associated protein 1-like isoform X2 [Mya arenaria]XP_052791101.1 HSPB1-associated protein 1-like isoform X2 [Mya arenaria]